MKRIKLYADEDTRLTLMGQMARGLENQVGAGASCQLERCK